MYVLDEISTLEASTMQKTSTINDLKHELANLRERLSWLEDEKQSLESATNIQSKNTSQELKSLEKVLNLKLKCCTESLIFMLF